MSDSVIQDKVSPWLRKSSMVLLATLPLLAWYDISFPVGLGFALVLFFSAYTIFINIFRVNVLPSAFWWLSAYIFLAWMYHHGFALWSIMPPGGWVYFIFVLALIWGVITLDLALLKKYMRWIVLISAILFWIQFLLKLSTGSQMFCFVPNLTGAFTYEGLSYSELVAHQLSKPRPCSIFLEPSYMAHYYVTYLAIMWFGSETQKKWLNKEVFFIIVTLVALESGSGIVALSVLVTIKLFKIISSASPQKRSVLMCLIIPIFAALSYLYLGSEMGQAMISRSEEFSVEGTSGYTRVVGGFLMFDQLDLSEKLIGILDARERFSVQTLNGRIAFFANGVQTILLSLGYIGALFYLIFYVTLFRKSSLASKACIIILLVMSLIESNYLNPFMMLLTIIPCADYYNNQHKESII